jgi:cytochrome c5
MKKLQVLLLMTIVLYSCAKKITDNKPVPKVIIETPTAKVETNPAKNTAILESPKNPSIVKDTNAMVAEAPKTEAPKENKLVVEGKGVYEIKCSRCHDLKAPENYNAEKWVKIIDWMGPRAKLDGTEKEAVLAYVSFYAKK